MYVRAMKLSLCCLGLVPVVGCMSSGMDMDAMVQPARPAELNHLDQFVGTWNGEWTMKVAGADEPVTGSGTNEIRWGVGNRYLVETMTMNMGEGKTGNGMGLWTWDPRAKKFRTWWFDDWGMNGKGTATYCPGCRCFCFKGKSYNMEMGMSTVGEGCMQFVDDNTMEWCWRERIPWTPFEIMQMCGKSTRQ